MSQNNLAESVETFEQRESQRQLPVVQEALIEDTQENEQRSSMAFSEKLLKQDEVFRQSEEKARQQVKEEYKEFIGKEIESKKLDLEIAAKKRELELLQ